MTLCVFQVSALCRISSIERSWQHSIGLFEIGQHVASAKVLLSVDATRFGVVARSQRGHGEENAAKTLNVLARTVGHLVLLPRLRLAGLRQSFHRRAVQLDFSAPVKHTGAHRVKWWSHRIRPQIRLFPDLPHFVEYLECARQLQQKTRSPLHNLGSTLHSDHLSVCRVSVMMITSSFMFTFCEKNMSGEHISTSLSMSSS